MIIHQIRATNLLKYRELSIDLGGRGLIGISGANESGKSTIGETVCFALFGRTFSIPPDQLQRVVRWGEEQCAVSLEFSVREQRYLLSRFLDQDGKHGAKLSLAANADEPIARGVQAVADNLLAILGFAYDEFIESFYLAQREITTPHPHSYAVKLMAGVAPLETVSDELASEIEERRELIDEINAEWEAVDGDIKDLDIQDGQVSYLEEARDAMLEQVAEVNRAVGDIDHGQRVHAAHTAAIYRMQGIKGRTGVLRLLALVLAVVAGAVWALLVYTPELPQAESIRGLLADYIPQWDESRLPIVGYISLALGGLFLLLWIRMAGIRRRIRKLHDESKQLAEALERARAIAIESDEAEQSDRAEESQAQDNRMPGRPDFYEYEMLRKLLSQGEATVRMTREFCERELVWLSGVAAKIEGQLSYIDEEIEEEQTRLQEAKNFSEVLTELSKKRSETEVRIAERQRGMELLSGALVHLSTLFNHDVKRLVARLLPLFTDGRYEHLEIGEDLEVQVFSNDKRDFMALEEVSSGTQRQIMLALRLALSKKLLDRVVKGRQFVFLDEPFAFFDKARTCTALHALADLDDEVCQVWIVAQDFPDDCDVQFDTIIKCERGSDILTLTN